MHKNYVIVLPALENIIFFSRFGPYSALIRHRVRPSGAESLTFGQTSQLKLETRLISSNCT